MGKKGTLCMLISITACLASAAVLSGTLVPCPDCGRDVSRRALMCPNCGLKGEVIAEPAKAGDAVVAPKQAGAQGFYKIWVSDAPIKAK